MKKYKSVEEFLQDQPPEKLEQINILRKIIMQAEPSLEENLKWNAPNYMHKGEDRITFNLMNKEGVVKLILHMGAAKNENKMGSPVMVDGQGIIVWNSDIRGTISFENLNDVQRKIEPVSRVVADWLALEPARA